MPVATEVLPIPRSPRPTHALRQIATQELQRESFIPKFEIERPRRRSLSPVPASPSAAASSSKSVYVPPPLTWRNAVQDAMAGIYYTKDAFPSSSFLPPPFSREPVTVEAGERVERLAEFDQYAVRVRVLRTDVVGLIPAWNTEGALERLTRMNTAFNEAATCPVEARALRRRYSECSSGASWDDDVSSVAASDGSLTHVHSRCARVRFPDCYGAASAYSDDDDSDSDAPQSPPEFERGRPLQQSQPVVFEAQPQTLEKGGISETAARSRSSTRKSVNFAGGERPQVMFRYPSEDLVDMFMGEKRSGVGAGDAESGSSEEGGEDEWWWQGWEEACEDSAEEEVDSGEESGNVAVEVVTEQRTIDLDELFPFAFDEAEL